MLSDMKETCKYLKIEVTEEQLIAGRYLESRGLMFCGHFGIENVIEKADILFDLECERAKEEGLLQ
jgi:hypothetical protein